MTTDATCDPVPAAAGATDPSGPSTDPTTGQTAAAPTPAERISRALGVSPGAAAAETGA